MDLCRVRYFLAVCEHGSFTAAANVCGVSQPSVTTGVARLERAVGGKLFERRHPVRLTPLGARVRPILETMQRAAAQLAAAIEESRGEAAGADSYLFGRGTNGHPARPAGRKEVLAQGAERMPDEPHFEPGLVDLHRRSLQAID